MKGTDLASYTQRFQELALMCGRMFTEESDKIEKYVGGLLDMIHGSVMTSKPKTMQDAVKFATKLVDKKIHTFAKSQTENKRKFEDTSRNNQNQQQQNKRQNTGRAYTVGPKEKKPYGVLQMPILLTTKGALGSSTVEANPVGNGNAPAKCMTSIDEIHNWYGLVAAIRSRTSPAVYAEKIIRIPAGGNVNARLVRRLQQFLPYGSSGRLFVNSLPWGAPVLFVKKKD
ncbi:hypothetical protein Tco_1525964 [Tanacetum coccineum]